ncbi:MAG: DegT/DnrJ/EryC1/StrS aminotransferase family protein [Gammaproteobacteria bacterium]|nr:DegT/DnrJ/EryC1/StrS aminotransferase family protein [Gammaproteobacteria bacterium]
MLGTAFPPWPSFTAEEADAVRGVLLSNRVNFWTGDECRLFEEEYARWAGCGRAIAVANGTVAIDAALHAINVGPGDEVIVTPRTFIASASSIAMRGARPVFADVDRDTQNLTARSIEPHITPATRAVLCVHLGGLPCDLDPIMELAAQHDLKIIEDCAQAHGARYKGRSVGTIGHIGTWSFCQDKIITTGGEGGMLTTDDEELWSRMWSYKDHGKSWHAVFEKKHPPGFRWVHESFGTNARMLEMQAAIGRIQLTRLSDWVGQRRHNARRIHETARELAGLRVPEIPAWAEHAAYRCYIFLERDELMESWDRARIVAEINKRGVPCQAGSCSEVYREKAFVDAGLAPPERLPVAAELGETSLAFLVHPTLQDEHIEKTCAVLREVMHNAARQT